MSGSEVTHVYVYADSSPDEVNFTEDGEYMVEDMRCPVCHTQQVTTAFMTPDANHYWHGKRTQTCIVRKFDETQH